MGWMLDNIAVEQEYHEYILLKMDETILLKEHPVCVCVIGVLRPFQQPFIHITAVAAY